jgi:hypothetical protein
MDLGRRVVVWHYTGSAHDVWCFIQVLRSNCMPVLLVNQDGKENEGGRLADVVRHMVQHFCTSDGNSLRASECVLTAPNWAIKTTSEIRASVTSQLGIPDQQVCALADMYDALDEFPSLTQVMDDLALWQDQPDRAVMPPELWLKEPDTLWQWVWPCLDTEECPDLDTDLLHICNRCALCQEVTQHWHRIYSECGPRAPDVTVSRPRCPII